MAFKVTNNPNPPLPPAPKLVEHSTPVKFSDTYAAAAEQALELQRRYQDAVARSQDQENRAVIAEHALAEAKHLYVDELNRKDSEITYLKNDRDKAWREHGLMLGRLDAIKRLLNEPEPTPTPVKPVEPVAEYEPDQP